MPKDPVMLLSYVNTQLRDNFSSLDELAASNAVSREEICEKIGTVGYVYDREQNRFVPAQTAG